MTRTEQFINGYDSCRSVVKSILIEFPELLANEKLLELAIFPYYKEDGQDWHPECGNCKHWDYDGFNDIMCCFVDVDITGIKNICIKKEVVINDPTT